MDVIKPDSLVLYKNRPARLVRMGMGDRIEIEMEGAETVRVRPKDVILLHPGPLRSLADLKPQQGDIITAWEILAGEKTSLADLSELAYGSYTPSTAWAAWEQISDHLYFSGNPAEVQAHTADEVERKKIERSQAEAEQRAWKNFVEHARRGIYDPSDRNFIVDVENLAYGRSERSQVMRDLGRTETPENAHSLLLELKAWDETVNPHPVRHGVTLQQVNLPVPPLPEENRIDLTHLSTYAIDDEDTDTPDDAISLDGERIWVHVADAAALVSPGSQMDEEALARATSLHLPEGTIHLLPRDVTLKLGLGIQEISPALSFGIDLGTDGDVLGFEVVTSWVRAQRLSYKEAEARIDQEPFRSLFERANLLRERRRQNQAVMIDFPEVKIKVEDRLVHISPIQPFRSRLIVEEAMILTGTQAARFASERGICLAYSHQDPVEIKDRPETLSGMFALRRFLKRSRFQTTPGPHHGLGASAYSQVTSPLRRYLDLVAHQQLRAYLAGLPGLSSEQVRERIDLVESMLGSLRQAETASELHWTMVYLLQHPGWRGAGILVDKRASSGTLILPDLALETRVHLRHDWPLDSILPVVCTGVNLPNKEASFRVVES